MQPANDRASNPVVPLRPGARLPPSLATLRATAEVGRAQAVAFGVDPRTRPKRVSWRSHTESLSRALYGRYAEQAPFGVSLETPADAEALKLWHASPPGDTASVGDYLAGLGIRETPPSIRGGVHALFPHLQLPVMVGGIQGPTGAVIAAAVTLLTWRGGPGGRPKLSPRWLNRWTLGDPGAGAVRFARASERLGLGVSIESGLAAAQATGIPTWAAIEADRLGKVWLPPIVRDVVLLVDHDTDPAMIDAAERMHREIGRTVRMMRPLAATWLESKAPQ